MQDYFEHYRDNLAGRPVTIQPGNPQCGYYKRRLKKGGPFVAAAIWRDSGDGTLLCRVGDDMVDPVKNWPWLAKHPAGETECRHWFSTGAWPSDAPAEPDADLASNLPADPYDALLVDINNAVEAAERLAKKKPDAMTDAEANTIGNRIEEMRKLASTAEKMRVAEKAPHLEAGRVVDAKFNPHIKRLDKALDGIKRVLGAWHDKKREEQRKAQEEAERVARAKEEAARGSAEPSDEPPPPQPPTPAPARIQVGGDDGRKVGFSVKYVVVVQDHAAALAHFAAAPSIQAEVERLAQIYLNQTGMPPPGCSSKEETSVR